MASMEVKIIFLLQDQLIPHGSVLNRRPPSKSHKISAPPLIGSFIRIKKRSPIVRLGDGCSIMVHALTWSATFGHGLNSNMVGYFNPRTHMECDSKKQRIQEPLSLL
ncbi:hypothetical protein [Paenibacillus polymyxa]|uniref:hypothetical protein n=1 Tax=Paenibacillus polymyxa TaxID=1406 RepID=UPI001866176D|nr:hypothetical protein [Paenibacillus polymyxa]